MKRLTANRTKKSKRTPVRLSFRDKQLLDKTLGQTIFSTRSEVVRAATTFLRDVWELKDNGHRIVVRNEESRLQYELFLAKVSADDLKKRGSFSKVEAADEKGKIVLIPNEPQEFDIAVPAQRADQGIIFEIRTSSEDLEVLNEILRKEIAPTPSQAIRTSLEVYSHVVNRCIEGYKVGAQSRSGELTYINVPGVGHSGTQAVVYLVNDRHEDREFLIEGFKLINIPTVSYLYESSSGPDTNLTKALTKARNLVKQGVRVFDVDLCWAFRREIMETDYLDPIEWGVVEGDEEHEFVSSFAGFKFIEALAWEPWSKELKVGLLTKRLSELEDRLNSTGLQLEARKELFYANIKDRFKEFKMYVFDVEAVESEKSFEKRAEDLVNSWVPESPVTLAEKPEDLAQPQKRQMHRSSLKETTEDSGGIHKAKKEKLIKLGGGLMKHTQDINKDMIDKRAA